MTGDFKAAQAAYRTLKARGKIPAGWNESRTLDAFFGFSSVDPWRASTPQVRTPTEGEHSPTRHGMGQIRCRECGKVWDVGEDEPTCS